MREKEYAIRWFVNNFFPKYRKARAMFFEEKILPRLRGQEVTLFTPWGPRYAWKERGLVIKPQDKEFKVIKLFSVMFHELQTNMPGKKFNWIFLGADLYGLKINNLPAEVVYKYFLNLEGSLKKILPEAEFILWSELSQEAEVYRREVEQNFGKYITPEVIKRAEKTAKHLVDAGNPREYLIERVAEAKLMEELFRPIKISCAPRHKDDVVDYELPRLYFAPEKLLSPWL